MPTYIAFYKLTDQGVKAIKEAPGRIEAGLKAAEQIGAKIRFFYVCQSGEFDYVASAEWPNDEVAKAYVLGLEASGNVRVTWTRVYEPVEFAGIVAKLQ